MSHSNTYYVYCLAIPYVTETKQALLLIEWSSWLSVTYLAISTETNIACLHFIVTNTVFICQIKDFLTMLATIRGAYNQ